MSGFARLAGWLAAACGVGAVLLVVLYLGLQWYLAQKRKAARLAKKKAKATGASSAERNQTSTAATNSAPDTDKELRFRHGPPTGSNGTRAAATVAAAERASPAGGGAAPARSAQVNLDRGTDVVRREAELKRDALHIFRRLQSSSDPAEKSVLCKEAVALYDDIERRVGAGMASITSGRIVFCNALMECGGLDELRECQDSRDSNATALVERVVPIIFST